MNFEFTVLISIIIGPLKLLTNYLYSIYTYKLLTTFTIDTIKASVGAIFATNPQLSPTARRKSGVGSKV